MSSPNSSTFGLLLGLIPTDAYCCPFGQIYHSDESFIRARHLLLSDSLPTSPIRPTCCNSLAAYRTPLLFSGFVILDSTRHSFVPALLTYLCPPTMQWDSGSRTFFSDPNPLQFWLYLQMLPLRIALRGSSVISYPNVGLLSAQSVSVGRASSLGWKPLSSELGSRSTPIQRFFLVFWWYPAYIDAATFSVWTFSPQIRRLGPWLRILHASLFRHRHTLGAGERELSSPVLTNWVQLPGSGKPAGYRSTPP